jgi:hypothetical protein
MKDEVKAKLAAAQQWLSSVSLGDFDRWKIN